MSTDTPYETLRQRHVKDARALMPAAIARLRWPADRLRNERTERLRHLIRLAKQRSVWHRQRLAHIDAETMTEEQLERVPPMTKDDLMNYFDEIATDRRLTRDLAEAHVAGLRGDAYLLERYHVNASGGSSGRRGVLVHDWTGWAEGFVGFARHLAVLLSTPGVEPRPFVGAVVAAHDPTHMSCAMPQTFADPTLAVWHRFPVSLPLAEIVDGLNGLQPDVVVGYASQLHQLAFRALAGELRIAPKLLVSTSEPLLPPMREVIALAWPRARLINFWASTEAAALAISCGHGRGMHLSDDLLIVEPVDRDGHRVAPGLRAARVYLTNLYNTTPLPLIRYEIDDEVTLLDEACPCGSAHRRIDDILGRREDGFVYAGGIRVHWVVFLSQLDRQRHVVEYQVRQTPAGAALALVCDGEVNLDGMRDALAADLRRLGLADPEVSVARVERIERQPRSGKLKRFVPLAASAAPATA